MNFFRTVKNMYNYFFPEKKMTKLKDLLLVETNTPEEYLMLKPTLDKVYSYEIVHEEGIAYHIWESSTHKYKVKQENVKFIHFTNLEFTFDEKLEV